MVPRERVHNVDRGSKLRTGMTASVAHEVFSQHTGQATQEKQMRVSPTAVSSPAKVRTIPYHACLGGQPLLNALRRHWPEYVMEGAELGLYMISPCAFVVLLEYPTSPVHQVFPDPALRRVLIGIAMGMTAIGIIYSPLGQRSGAHFNPAVTFTFFRLGKVEFWDAAFYGAAQFIGGLLGMVLSALVSRRAGCSPLRAVRRNRTTHGWNGRGVSRRSRHLLPANVTNLALL
jgi:hypothetical protein